MTATSSRPRVLVSREVFPDIVDRLRVHFDVEDTPNDRTYTSADLAQRLAGCHAVFITGSEPLDATVLDANPQLRVISTMAVGYNNIDLAGCTARKVLVTNAPDVLTETTADFGFALMMATARRITEGEHFLRSGLWNKWAVDQLAGQDIHGAVLGVLGMGRIGRAIARRGALGFGMKVKYHNRSRLDAAAEAEIGARYVDLPTLLREADHLVIVVPGGPSSHHLIGPSELAQMKPSATLTNIARGGVVDDAALAESLASRRIAAAGLDVFEGEPSVNPALLALENVVLTPHIASSTVATRRAMANLAVDNLIAALGAGPDAGRPLTPLNPEVLEGR